MFWEWNCDNPEPSLQTGVDEEGTGSWVHCCDVLSVLNVSESPLGAAFVPMLVVFVLTEQGNSILSLIGVKLGHVQIIDELKELVLAEGGIGLTRLLFEHGFELELEQC